MLFTLWSSFIHSLAIWPLLNRSEIDSEHGHDSAYFYGIHSLEYSDILSVSHTFCLCLTHVCVFMNPEPQNYCRC